MAEEYAKDGPCYRCETTSNVTCDACLRFACPDHRVIYNDPESFHGERLYCFDCAKKKGETKKEGCFIATAAYGTPFCNELDLLRSFRDKSLKKSFLGRLFVDFYYWVSPPIASFISKHEILRKAVRVVLSPFVRVLKKQ